MLVPRLLGIAADQLGDEDAAVDHLQHAIAVAERIGAEPELARAHTDLATIWSRRGDHRAARDLVDRASESFERLAMLPDLERAEGLTGGRVPTTAPRNDDAAMESVFIFFSDVVESTRNTEELGTIRYRAVARQVETLVRSAVVAHGGSIVSGINLGDGLIGLFSSPERAIAAARRCAAVVPSTGLHLHLAVHGGEVIVDGPRIFGGPVNYAARICDLTGPDEILVSELIRDAVAGLDGIAFVDRGEHLLKGIDGAQRVYAVLDPVDSEADLMRRVTRAQPAAPGPLPVSQHQARPTRPARCAPPSPDRTRPRPADLSSTQTTNRRVATAPQLRISRFVSAHIRRAPNVQAIAPSGHADRHITRT